MENIEFESFDNIENDDSGRLYEMGKSYYDSGSDILAEKYLKEAAKGGNRKAFLLLADIYLKYDKLNLAEKYLKKIADGGDFELQDKLGTVYKRKSNFELAEYYYKQAISNGNQRAQYHLGKLYYLFKKKNLAIDYLKPVADERDQEAQVLLAKIYYDNGQVDLAEEYLHKAKDNGEAYYLLGKLYGEKQDIETAEKHLKTAADDYDNKRAQEVLSNLYTDKNNLTLAKHYLTLLADENHLEAFALLGNIFADEKNYNLAYTNYGHFFEGKKRENAKVDMKKIDDAKLKFNFGKCCIKLGKFDIAEQNLKDSEYLKISDNVIEVAKLYEEAEQLKLAIQYYKSALHV